jgi:acyltransferase
MPLFFFVSGYCSNNTNYSKLSEFYKNRKKKLIRPYISLIILGLLFTFIYDHGIHTSWLVLFFQVFIYTQPETLRVGQIWFLSCLFVTELIYFVIYKAYKSRKLLIFMPIISGILGWLFSLYTTKHSGLRLLPFRIDTALTALVFYGTGNIVREMKISFNYSSKAKLFIVLLTSLILNIIFGLQLNGNVNIVDLLCNNIVYYYIASFSVIIFFASLARAIRSNKFIEFYGKNSLIIFSSHSFILYSSVRALSILFNKTFNVLRLSFPLGILLTVTTMVFEIPIVYIFKTYLSFIYGIKVNSSIEYFREV